MEEELHFQQQVLQMEKEQLEVEGVIKQEVEEQPKCNVEIHPILKKKKSKSNIHEEEQHIDLPVLQMEREQVEVKGVEVEE